MNKRCILLALLVALSLLLGACSLPDTPPDATKVAHTCASMVAAIAEGQEFEELTELTDNQILKYLQLNDGVLADMAMSMDASSATAECIVVLSAIDDQFAQTAFHALDEYRNATLETYRDYQPDEVPKLENAIIRLNGLQCVLIVCKDTEAAEKTLAGLGW